MPKIKSFGYALIVISCAWTVGSAQFESVTPDTATVGISESFAAVAERVKPTVVSLTTEHVETVGEMFFFGDPFKEFFQEFHGDRSKRHPSRRRVQGMGSGVVVSEDGYILTNEHVVREAETIRVRVSEKENYRGKVIGRDARSDLAVVKIDPKGKKLNFTTLGNSADMHVGDWVLAVGSPFGLEQTVTAGIVSAVRQSLVLEGQVYPDLIQTDASINRGNSGGPLVNMRGEVVGINTAIYAPTGVFAGVGFAIPSSHAQNIMRQLMEKGKVVRGWLGVEILSLDEVLAAQFGVTDSSGAVVNRVLPGSPAEKAGLRRGDVLREFNGSNVLSAQSLQDLTAETPPRTKITVGIVRDGKEKSMTVVTAEMPQEESGGAPEEVPVQKEEERPAWQGASLSAVTPTLSQRYRLPPAAAGVVVLSVEPGSQADQIGLVEGDLVSSINRRRLKKPLDFIRALKEADLRKGVVLDLYRLGRWTYLTYRED